MRYTPQIRTQHPSHRHLRNALNPQPFRSVVRLGSKTVLQECFPHKTDAQRSKVVEINTVQSIKNSSDKLAMKNCFTTGRVKTASWIAGNSVTGLNDLLAQVRTLTNNWDTSVIAKHRYGSRGTGNYKLDNERQLQDWVNNKNLSDYIFEKFYNFSREYRLHVTKDGCFYTNRKLRRNGTPDNQRWFFNDTNSNWILQTNPLFDRPSNWSAIVAECVKALRAVGLDIGGFDVKVQSRLDNRNRVRQTPEFIIIESNSACSHGDVTAVKYREELNRLLNERATNYVQGIEETVSKRRTITKTRGAITTKKLIRR